MAFESLGVNLVAGGIRGVANDVGHLALSFLKYIRAVEQADRASIKTAASQSKLADAMAGKSQRSVDRLEKQYVNLTIKSRSLQAAIAALNTTMRDPVAAQAGYAQAIADVQRYEQAIIQFQATARRTKAGALYKRDAAVLAVLRQQLADANVELNKQAKNYAAVIKAQSRHASLTDQLDQVSREFIETQNRLGNEIGQEADALANAADMQQRYQDAVAAAGQQTNIFGRLLSDLTGGFGQSTAANSALIKGLSLTVPQLTAVMVAMDATKLAIRAAQIVMTITVKVIQTLWNAFKKLVGIVWDVAKAIGKTLWGALTKIAGAPFKLIASLFGGMHGSMQRVMEMAIGMNLSRVWWQLGMKMRDMARMASDAAVDYQVTFNRLRSLILNEIVDTQYAGNISSIEQRAEALKKAQLATEELVKWTSKLAVSTIYDASDILDVYTLAMSYNFTSDSARNLTEAVLDFATGMGLGDTEMRRVIENFGQLRAQGKITGTELRDLARGAFVPVNDVLEQMAKNAGLVGDYDIPNMQAINGVLADMRDNGELTADAFAAINTQLQKLGADGRVTRQEFETLMQDMSKGDVMQRFGLTAEQAGKALEGIKTGQLTEELNELIKTGELTIDEFFEAFIEIAENRFPNAARSMGMTMKAVKSNIEDYISTMIGWRLIAPVLEVVAKHTQDFIQNVLMSDKQIAQFDKMGKAFKVVTEIVLAYSNAVQQARQIGGTFFSFGPLTQLGRFTKEFISILGSLGTEDFDKQMGLFDFALKSIDLSFDSRNIVTSGIKSLNKIMQDITAGVEIDPTELKQAMDDVFGTLWRDFFGPKIKESLEIAWEDYIKPAIGKLWENMRTAFNNWKTNTLLPGIRTFFSETLPGWITGFQNWITNNGPKIIEDIGTFVSAIFREFKKLSSENFGEKHPLTLLFKTLEGIALYATTKILDPTSDINKENLDAVKDSLKELESVLAALALNRIFNSDIGKKFMEAWNSDVNQEGLKAVADFLYTLVDIGTVDYSGAGGILALIADIVSLGNESDKKGASGISSLTNFITRLAASFGILAAIPSAGVFAVLGILGSVVSLIKTVRTFRWDADKNFLTNIVEFVNAFNINNLESNTFNTFITAFDDLLALVEKVSLIDIGALRTKLRNIVDGLREFFGLEPKDWPPIKMEFEFEIPPLEAPDGYYFDEDGYLRPIIPESSETEIDVSVKVNTVFDTDKGTKAPTTLQDLLGGSLFDNFGPQGPTPLDVGPIAITIPELKVDEAGLETAVASASEPIAASMSAKLKEAGATGMSGLADGIIDTTPAVGAVLQTSVQNLNAPVEGMQGSFNSAGANAVAGLRLGMEGQMNALLEWWKLKVGELNDIMPTLNNQNSPSRLYRSYGEDMMLGLQLGLESGQRGAVAQIHDAAIELRQTLGAINSGPTSPQQYSNISNTTNWNVNVSTPLVASTPIQAYEILRMRAR